MIIGNFISDTEGIRFTGELGYPFPNALVVIEPTFKTTEGSPDYRVLTQWEPGRIVYEFGAAWQRTSREGKPYLSIKLDSPLFREPVNCRLVGELSGELGGAYRLIWSRDDRKQDTPIA